MLDFVITSKSCSEQKIWEHLNCMLSKVRGRAKKDAGARLGVEGLRSIRRGAYRRKQLLKKRIGSLR